jgi:hypothetical protein
MAMAWLVWKSGVGNPKVSNFFGVKARNGRLP